MLLSFQNRSLPVLGLIAAATLTTLVSGTFLPDPELKWRFDLDTSSTSSSSVLAGNAVRVTDDGSRIFVTTRGGRLHILDGYSQSGKVRTVYEPDPLPSYCSSGVALYDNGADDEAQQFFAVYAVVDDGGSATEVTSRVIAVDRDGRELWTVEVDGEVQGTPIVREDGRRVYVVHNRRVSESAFFEQVVGSVSVIDISTFPVPPSVPNTGTGVAAQYYAQISTTLSSDDFGSPATLGTPTGRSIPNDDYDDGEEDSGDNSPSQQLILVAASVAVQGSFTGPGGGSSGGGSLYAIMPDQGEWFRVSNYPMPTSLPPALSEDGSKSYLAHGQMLTAWDDNNRDIMTVIEGGDEDIFPSWEETIDGPDSNPFARK